MNKIFTILTVFMSVLLQAQTIATLEDISVPQDSFLNGKFANGSFQSANAIFPNEYNVMFDFWNGWAMSSKKDSITSGYSNQYGAKAGSGYSASANYAVSYGSENVLRFTSRVKLDGFYITNNTYAYNSMRDGDQFAKRFGGETGNDPDFLRLTIYKFLNGVQSTDSVNFYLADFRFVNNTQDYIIKNWTYVNLSALGEADSLFFRMASSDVGDFGINTPTYFCLDNLSTTPLTTAVNDLQQAYHINIFPNPIQGWIEISWQGSENGIAQLFDLNGKLIQNAHLINNSTKIDLFYLPKGVYLLKIIIGNQFFTQKIIKQ